MPAVEGVGAVAFVAVALTTDDRLATAMAAVAAAVLAVLALRDALARVRVRADEQGVTVVHGFAARRLVPWNGVVGIAAGGRGRFGGRSQLLEIDTGDTVHLFSRRELGADPAEVAEALEALRGQALNP